MVELQRCKIITYCKFCRKEGTALVANIGVTTFFHGITNTKLGRIYL